MGNIIVGIVGKAREKAVKKNWWGKSYSADEHLIIDSFIRKRYDT